MEKEPLCVPKGVVNLDILDQRTKHLVLIWTNGGCETYEVGAVTDDAKLMMTGTLEK